MTADPTAGDRLADLSRSTGGLVVAEHVPLLAQVDLRLDPETSAGGMPFPLPVIPNTAWEASDGSRAALWLGPDEWLVLGPPGSEDRIVAELERASAGTHHSVVDVTANRVAIELSGPRAKELLSFGCGLDLDARSWAVGSCAQTLVARVQVILHERSESTGILVRPSFADHFVEWLLDAAGGLEPDPSNES